MTVSAQRTVIAGSTSAQAPLGLPSFIIIAAATFNGLLAIINAHLAPLSPQVVILGEVCLLAGAHLYACFHYRSEMAVWYLLLGLMLIVFFIRWLITGEMEPKYFRDTAIIPTFIILGLASDERDLDRTILIILAVVTVIAFIEAIFPDTYSDIFNVQDYYISTRGNALEDFYAKDSTLFVSAVRPDDRFFSFIDAPRLSSIFLEPVSLGNFCTIIVAFLIARSRKLSSMTLVLSAAAAVFLLAGSDGRLAAASIGLIVAGSLITPYLPRFSVALYLPLALLATIVLVLAIVPDANEDNFSGRLAHTVDVLGRFQLVDWSGLSDKYLEEAMDSGIAYLVSTQSIFGVAAIWLFLVCASEERNPEQIRYTHALLLYFVLTMMVSYSMLTIKTAAVAWFIHGLLQQPKPGFQTQPVVIA